MPAPDPLTQLGDFVGLLFFCWFLGGLLAMFGAVIVEVNKGHQWRLNIALMIYGLFVWALLIHPAGPGYFAVGD